ncbi:MAG: phospholipid carrier-dependent glycosyltransferase [Candidatus Moranbacteria bacterium]|nr:phospholipid carrier-dependent glycosyltransferase [Candidatus Moranbacteria bacterium]
MKILKKHRIKIFLSLVLAVYFFFGFTHLTKFVSFDEHYWLYNADNDRIHQYWNAIALGDWKDTRINDKPGITLAYTSGLALLLDRNPDAQVLYTDKTVKIFNPAETEKINFLFRLPILLVSGFFAVYFFWILKKITRNEWLALLAVALTYLSPVIIGMSQIVNPDSMFWIFSFAAMLTYAAWLKLFEKKYFWLTLVFFGLSMASKYVSIILIPFFLFMLLAYYLFEFSGWEDKQATLKRIVFKNSLAYVGIIAGGFLIFAMMMPAVFVEPKYFYSGTIGFPGMAPIFWLSMLIDIFLALDAYFNKNRVVYYLLEKLQLIKKIAPKLIALILLSSVVFVLVNWMLRHRLVDLSDISFDMKRKPEFSNLPYAYRFIMETVPLVFASLPLILFSLIYLWAKNIFQKVKQEYLTFIFSAFIIIFYLAVIKEGLVLTIRYSIILYPISALLSAIALQNFFGTKTQEDKKKSRKFLILLAVLFSVLLLLFGASSFEQAKIISEANLRVFYNFHRFIFSLIVLSAVAFSTKIIYTFLSWKKLRSLSYSGIYALVLISSFVSIWLIKPYYFSYSNDFLPKKYIITSGWGYGGYEAAQVLNKLPNAENTTVWADSYGFCEFYVGKCIHKIKIRTAEYPIDYFYSTLQSQLRPEFIGSPYKEDGTPVFNLEIDGRYKNYVRILKAKRIDPAGSSLNE